MDNKRQTLPSLTPSLFLSCLSLSFSPSHTHYQCRVRAWEQAKPIGLLWNQVLVFLTLAAKRRREGYCNHLAIFVRQSQPSYARSSERESMHSRHKGIVVILSPSQWCSSVQLLPSVFTCTWYMVTSASYR